MHRKIYLIHSIILDFPYSLRIQKDIIGNKYV